jgi:hypothetical protein
MLSLAFNRNISQLNFTFLIALQGLEISCLLKDIENIPLSGCL